MTFCYKNGADCEDYMRCRGGKQESYEMSQVPEKEGKVQLECLHDDSVCEGPTLDKCVLIFLKEITSNSFDGLAGLV